MLPYLRVQVVSRFQYSIDFSKFPFCYPCDNVISVVEFQRWWVLKSKICQKSTTLKKSLYFVKCGHDFRTWNDSINNFNKKFTHRLLIKKSILGIENSLWISDVGTFWQTPTHCFHYGFFWVIVDLWGQKSCFFGPTILKIPQPKWQ